MNQYKLDRAVELEDEADELRKQAFEERLLPDHWKIGQIVRLIKDKERCAGRNSIAVVTDVSEICSSIEANSHLNVFWITPLNGRDKWNSFEELRNKYGCFYTTSDEVELVC